MSDDFWTLVAKITPKAREASVEVWLVQPLLEALGHDRCCIEPQVPVLFQEGREKRKGRKPEADFVVYAELPFSRATSLIVVETKRPNEALDDGREQGESYAQNLRTPLLLMTNGVTLEIWQNQITTESVRLFQCSVDEIGSRRGDIEGLLSREAIKAHCSTIEYKHFDLLARNLIEFERDEHSRVSRTARFAVERRLTNIATNRASSWLEILDNEHRGAIITASSGFGKTVLAASLLCESIERRWEATAMRLPVEIFLPDLSLSRQPILDFITARISSHKPGFGTAALAGIVRSEGLVVFADGFERLSLDQREDVESIFRTLLRDYPKAAIFIMSRASVAPQGLGLSIYTLDKYSRDDLQELDKLYALTHSEGRSAFGAAPDYVYRMAEVPLLARLIQSYFNERRRHTTEIAALYETWLEKILLLSRPLDRALDRLLLEQVALATTKGPISIDRAVSLERNRKDPHAIIARLIESDALSLRGSTVELKHEALADFFRVKQLWAGPSLSNELRLVGLPIERSSQYAVLLVGTAPTAGGRGDAWKMIAKIDLKLAIRTLYIAAGDETFQSGSSPLQSQNFLADIKDTINILSSNYFHPISKRIVGEIAGIDIEVLGIEGEVNGENVSFWFFDAGAAKQVVRVGTSEAR